MRFLPIITAIVASPLALQWSSSFWSCFGQSTVSSIPVPYFPLFFVAAFGQVLLGLLYKWSLRPFRTRHGRKPAPSFDCYRV
ncbi:hypothetical protein AMELA_G00100550 [Ameiurus melas]|uniref:Uncharacterized protein n=1 Tax=Ameiurus melas TaxID=219545 RepID=A0A7J6AWK1_AMEME|nr:hypothetical protein AMELA_G00100550 [Ameiurus melas]